MQIRWHPDARLEAGQAARFYGEKRSGLEQRFLDMLADALQRISRHPHMYATLDGNIHKCKVARFPYGMIYRTKPESIEIIAVMHLRREPGYWKSRSG